MKSVTEFAVFSLQKGQTVQADLATQGKTPEEIEASMGESFKLEGEKLKYFLNAINVAKEATSGRLKRILVVTFGENETVPAKAVKVDETYYLADYHLEAPKVNPDAKKTAEAGRGKGRDRNNKGGGRGNMRKRPEDPAKVAEAQKYGSSDGRATDASAKDATASGRAN